MDYVNVLCAEHVTTFSTSDKFHPVPSRGVSKITTDRLRRFQEVRSIIHHMFGIGQPSVYTAIT